MNIAHYRYGVVFKRFTAVGDLTGYRQDEVLINSRCILDHLKGI